jgi:hypothetical protein
MAAPVSARTAPIPAPTRAAESASTNPKAARRGSGVRGASLLDECVMAGSLLGDGRDQEIVLVGQQRLGTA